MSSLPERFNPKVLNDWLDKGLVNEPWGEGKETVNVQQAVALSLGLSFNDNPEVAGNIDPGIESFVRFLGNGRWLTKKSRANGIRHLAFEQLGSKGIDFEWFRCRMADMGKFHRDHDVYKQIELASGEPKEVKEQARENYMTFFCSVVFQVMQETKRKAGISCIVESESL